MQLLLDVPGKEAGVGAGAVAGAGPALGPRALPPRKPSPKRSRARAQPPISSSSSSESLNSARELSMREKPDHICWPDHREEEWGSTMKGRRLSAEASGEDTGEVRPAPHQPNAVLPANKPPDTFDAASYMLPKMIRDELPKPHRKISRLRTISNQIRFLRRLEQSLKRRERLVSQSDSYGDDDDGCEGSPPVMSPLLPHQSALHDEFKNTSLGHLRHQPHLARARSSSRHRLGSKQKHTGEFLIPYEEQMQWKAVKVAENNGQVE